MLCWVLLAGGLACEQPVHLVIRSDPSEGVLVADQFGDLGLAGQSLRLRQLEGQAQVSLVLRKEGWADRQLQLEVADLKRESTYPPPGQPPLRLEPRSASAYLQRYGLGLLATGGVLALALGLWRSRARTGPASDADPASPDPTTDSRVRPGTQLGPYRVRRRLGQGGMATVVEVVRSDDPQAEARALKLLQKSQLTPEYLARFQREIRLSQKLVHPHIAQLYDFDLEMPYLVMELVEGGTLRERVAPELPLGQVAEWLRQLFSAVAFAHQHGVVHRDLKPENVLLTRQGAVKVSDFGLALHQESHTITQSGTILGSPAYMAPEQIQGCRFDYATDQYALGVISFELLTGRRPFEEEQVMLLLRQHMMARAPAASSLRLSLSPQVDAVLERMLAKSPEQRFGDVREAALALAGALDGG